MSQPALAVLEYSSIAVGTRAGDAVVKKASIATYRAGTIHPGHFLILITGSVGDVGESYREGLRVGGDALLDSVFLPDAHSAVQTAVAGKRTAPAGETLGIIETATVSATVHAADRAVKGAIVTIREIRLGDGLGGKGIVHLDGELPDVQAAIALACDVITPRNIAHRTTIIPAVHSLVTNELRDASRFHR
jgi:microcompartment protein CcmL/EutN